MKIGILGALPEEIDGITQLISNRSQQTLGMRTYYSGELCNIPVVVVFSRWGKVAAATTVATLIHQFDVTHILFTGVAGAIDDRLRIGDIVVAKRLVQHDLDGRPIMQQFEIPLLHKTFIESDERLFELSRQVIATVLESRTLHRLFDDDTLASFGIRQPSLYTGDIASGDQFFYRQEQKDFVHNALPGTLCVEMEGAAVAQVCFEHGIPFTIIRTISDTADHNSHIDFVKFIRSVSSKYAVEIVRHILEKLS